MRRFAVVNQKGGVGKTTTALSLGALLARDHAPVLLVDLDPHGSLTTYFGLDPDRVQAGSQSLFDVPPGTDFPPLESLAVPTGTPNLILLPAASTLATIERRLASAVGTGLVLRTAIEKSGSDFSHILIDTPPTLGVLMINALAACEQVIIPAQTDYLALRGLDLVSRTLERVRKTRHWPLPELIVPTFYDRRTKASEAGLAELKRRYPERLWPDVIPIDSGIRNASAAGIPYPAYNPRGKATRAYERLLSHLLPREGNTE